MTVLPGGALEVTQESPLTGHRAARTPQQYMSVPVSPATQSPPVLQALHCPLKQVTGSSSPVPVKTTPSLQIRCWGKRPSKDKTILD